MKSVLPCHSGCWAGVERQEVARIEQHRGVAEHLALTPEGGGLPRARVTEEDVSGLEPECAQGS